MRSMLTNPAEAVDPPLVLRLFRGSYDRSSAYLASES